jgi:hypothetical protein|tara:strand:+ start:735 stop:1172 length:438 start_codon:yes stop_codon:yes gene_type:complete
MAKQGREVRTDISDVFRTSYGTVDSSTLKSLYLNLSTWIEPLEEVDNWDRPIKKFKYMIDNLIHRELKDTEFKQKAIVDLDLRASGMRLGKRSFMRCEVTMFLNSRNKHNIKSIILSKTINDITKKVINGPLSTTKSFKFHKKKK